MTVAPILLRGSFAPSRRARSDDDPVRLIRAPRFAAQLGLTVSDETRKAIRLKAGMLTRSSPERVRDELLKIFAAPGVMSSIRTLDDLDLLSVVLPELDEAREVSAAEGALLGRLQSLRRDRLAG